MNATLTKNLVWVHGDMSVLLSRATQIAGDGTVARKYM